MKTDPNQYGHLRVPLRRDGKRKRTGVHRLVLEAFVGPCPDDMECCHNNGDPNDNRLENLRWDTRQANHLDSVAHGRQARPLRTHCPRRHPLGAPNNTPGAARVGRRSCLACDKANHQRRYLEKKNRAGSFDFQAASDGHYAVIMAAAAA